MATSEINTTITEAHLENGAILQYDPLESVPMAPEDPMFGLSAAFRKDKSSHKVDLGVGAYRDEKLEPFVLPVVQKV